MITNSSAAGISLLDRKIEAATGFALHHVANSREIALPFLTIKLPAWMSAHGLTLVLMTLVTVLVFSLLFRRSRRASSVTGGVVEAFVIFVRDSIARRHLGNEWGDRLTPLFCTFFSFILFANVIALAPSVPSVTSNLSVTGALAVISLSFMIGGGIYVNGFGGFVRGFMVPGLPAVMQLFMVPLEFFSMLVKSVALMIRLFANMLAGHLALFLLAGVAISIGLAAAPLALLVLFVYFLELFFAVLQAYIFTMLSAVFIGQRLHPGH